jgi:DNA repair protein RecO (recombination protein O)
LENAKRSIAILVEITAAILLRRIRFSETSLVITWFSEAHGKLKTVAKGARRPKSLFAGKLDLFFDAEIQFVRSRKSDLHILKELVLREPFEGIRQRYARVQIASYCVELVELVTEPEHAAPDIYDLLKRAFEYLNAGEPTKRALLHFELELVRLLGIQGAANVTPAVAVGRAYGRLPAGRAELLKQLP